MAARKPKLLGVEFSGPFFERDPGRTFRQNARALLEGMAREGQEAIRREVPVRTGAFRAGVIGRIRALTGKPWQLTGVISAQHVEPWPGGGQKEYRGGKIEVQRHMFRRTTSALRTSRAAAVADLAKGLE